MADTHADGAILQTVAASVSDWLSPAIRSDDDGGLFLRLTATDRPHGMVDLSAATAGLELRIEVFGSEAYEQTPIRFSGLNGHGTVRVEFTGQPAPIVVTHHAGTLVLTREVRPLVENTVFVGPEVTGRLVLEAGSFALAADPFTLRELRVDVRRHANVPLIAWLPDLSAYPLVRLAFNAMGPGIRFDDVPIPCPAVLGLRAPGDAVLAITAGGGSGRVTDVAGRVAAIRPEVIPEPPMLEIIDASAVVIDAAVDVSIGRRLPGDDAPFGLDVHGVDGLSNVLVHGPAEVWIEATSRAVGLGSHPAFGPNDLSAAPATVVTGLAGPWRLARAEGAHVSGGPGGFGLVGVAAADSGSRADTVRDAVVTGFELPSRTERRSAVAALESAHHADPATTELPGAGRRYRWPRPLFLRREPDLAARLPEDAEFVDALARLARDKGAPGATRTKIAWCAYRLRHLAARSAWERLTLAGYRLLGYGERPAPALLTWLVLALLSTVVSVWAVDPQVSVAEEFLSYAFAPVGVVMHTGAPNEQYAWQYLLRAVVAVPLVTGLIALRNFVKQGRA